MLMKKDVENWMLETTLPKYADCGEDSKTYNKLSIVYKYNIHHHTRNKLSLSINVILKPSEETNHLSLTSH